MGDWINKGPVWLKLEEPGTIEEIPIGCVCTNSKYVFDRPVTLPQNAYLRMENGQFWYVAGSKEVLLEGKWDRE